MRTLRFEVSGAGSRGDILYAGGVNSGDVIALGDELRLEQGGADTVLRVRAILTYGRYVNVLPSGMAGELEFAPSRHPPITVKTSLAGQARSAAPKSVTLGYGEFHTQPI